MLNAAFITGKLLVQSIKVICPIEQKQRGSMLVFSGTSAWAMGLFTGPTKGVAGKPCGCLRETLRPETS